MLTNRRQFIKQLLIKGTSGIAMTAGLLHTTLAHALWPEQNYIPRNYPKTLRHLFKDAEFISSRKIKLGRLPHVAENGAVVPISVTSTLKNVNKIYILVEKNPYPLIAEFYLSPAVVPHISARIKMAKTSKVIVLIEADGKLYHKSKVVKVALGGCG